MVSFKLTRFAFSLPDGSELPERVKEHTCESLEHALLIGECYGYSMGAWKQKYGKHPKVELEINDDLYLFQVYDRLKETYLSYKQSFTDTEAQNWIERIL